MWADSVIMVRPTGLAFNAETAPDNAFQVQPRAELPVLRAAAVAEFEQLVDGLRLAGIHVHVAAPPAGEGIPDAVFPNNWLTTHDDGRVVQYPLAAANRRRERRESLFSELEVAGYRVQQRLDLTSWEAETIFLEGTGSLVLDRRARIAFAALSPRTSAEGLARWCRIFDYRPCLFQAVDPESSCGVPVYHTNVILSLGRGWAVFAAGHLLDPTERRRVETLLQETGREIITIDSAQVRSFAGNILQLQPEDSGCGVVAMSASAHRAFSAAQRERLAVGNRLVAVEISTIERCGGGSVRCMLAENFLPRAGSPD